MCDPSFLPIVVYVADGIISCKVVFFNADSQAMVLTEMSER